MRQTAIRPQSRTDVCEEIPAMCEQCMCVSRIQSGPRHAFKVALIAAMLDDLQQLGRQLITALEQRIIPQALHGCEVQCFQLVDEI